MNKLTASALIAILTLTACKDDMQAQLEQQQKQIEALQQQLEQQADDTVYQLAPDAVKETIPAAHAGIPHETVIAILKAALVSKTASGAHEAFFNF